MVSEVRTPWKCPRPGQFQKRGRGTARPRLIQAAHLSFLLAPQSPASHPAGFLKRGHLRPWRVHPSAPPWKRQASSSFRRMVAGRGYGCVGGKISALPCSVGQIKYMTALWKNHLTATEAFDSNGVVRLPTIPNLSSRNAPRRSQTRPARVELGMSASRRLKVLLCRK